MINKSIVVKVVRLFLGGVFVLSAVAKIYSMAFFDDLVASQLLGASYLADPSSYDSFYWVQWLTRTLIAGEFMLGVAILQDKHLKTIVLPAMLGVLVLFTIQIVYAASFQGKGYIGGNCGCFGDVIPFDNFETIVKNVVLVGLTFLVAKWYKKGEQMNMPPVLIPYVVGATTLFTLYLTIKPLDPPSQELNHIDFSELFSEPDNSDSLVHESISDSLPVKEQIDSVLLQDTVITELKPAKVSAPVVKLKKPSVFSAYTNFSNGEVKDLDVGTHLICLFSYSCGHCQETYREIIELKKRGGDYGNLYILGYGSELDKQYFWNQAGGVVAPHITIDDYSEFGKLLEGESFPRVIVKKNGITKKTWNINTYTKENLFNYFNIKMQKETTNDLNQIDLDNENSIDIGTGIDGSSDPFGEESFSIPR